VQNVTLTVRKPMGFTELNQKGLTLPEILIALAINSIVILAVVSVVSQAMLTGKSSENRQELATDFGLLQNYFAREIPNAGGMSLPAESAFMVENNCGARGSFPACAGSDRLTVAASDAGPVCTIQSWDSAGLNATFPFDASNICCLITTPILKQQVMFVNGFDYRQLWVQQVDTAACTAKFQLGPMGSLGPTGLYGNTPAAYDWTSGVVIPVNINTFYLDTNTFMRYSYKNPGANADEGEALTLADRVIDFQAMLGYDFNPADGTVDDTGTTGDEWMYNKAGEGPGLGVFATLPKNSLRMIGVGWVLGTPAAGNTGAKTGSVLDGPVRSKAGWVLQTGTAKFGVRSIYVFD
jgi:prepilin-type N-terminal cleavage/methylation domain-containing protein